MEIKPNLNSRQFALYNYLKAKKPDEWTKQEQIAKDLEHIYIDNDWTKPFHDRRIRQVLTADIRVLNANEYIHKPILSGVKGVKIANEQEFDDYINSQINSTIRRLKRLKLLASKADKNNQYRLKLSAYQKEVYDCFLS